MQKRTLPAEVTDNIVDQLHATGDKKSLSSIALASSTFLARAQSSLFRVIDLNKIRCLSLNSKRYTSFKELLIESPRLRWHVRTFLIGNFLLIYMDQGFRCPDSSHPSDESSSQHFLDREAIENCSLEKAEALASILGMLPRVEHFAINYPGSFLLEWHALPPATQTAIAAFCQQISITSLYLNRIMDLPPSLIANIAQLSQLTSLHLEDISVDLENIRSLNELTNLKSSLTKLRKFWLIPPGLYAGRLQRYNINIVGEVILQAARESLEYFAWHSLAGRHDPINVGILRNLKFICLRLDSLVVYSVAVRPLIVQLTQVERATVEVIELWAIQSISGSELKRNMADWTEFDELLQHSTFSRLVEIRVIEYYPHSLLFLENPPKAAVFPTLFPKSRERGVKVKVRALADCGEIL
ncbi:hypothetical protein BDZ97DRAFT_1919531 [Flammula alnicola]|nr:hypothetical protein BDZ97DRAFT_1919531 [Flammula alnicola]